MTTIKIRSVRGPKDCDCYYCQDLNKDQKGGPTCEGYNHHCPFCHDNNLCTTIACQEERDANATK